MNRYSFSIIIPTLGSEAAFLLNRTLISIAEAFRPQSLIEILVVENGHAGKAKSICDELGDLLPITYLYSKDKGASPARNLGARESKGDILLFFDDDIRLGKNTLEAYDQTFQLYGTQFFFGGPVAIDYESKPDPDLIPFLPDSARGFSFGNQNTLIETSRKLFLGANHAIPRWAIEKEKGYDNLGTIGKNCGFIGEETRLQEKLLQAGLKGFYIANATVWHFVPKDSCNEQWLLDRYYRRGLTEGSISSDPSRRFMGVPAWIWRSQIENTLRHWKLILSGSSRSQHLAISLESKRLQGLIDSYRPH